MLKTLFASRTVSSRAELFKSILSSIVSFALDFSIFLFLTEVVGLYYVVSSAVGFVAGTSLSYVLSVYWIFAKRKFAHTRLEFFIFLGVGLIGVGLNSLLLYIFTEYVGIYYAVSKIISASIVFFFNFFSRKIILFR
jgi:putative flippase GtrA